MVYALSQLLPTSIATATAWWQLTVLVSVEELPLKMSAEFAEEQELLTVHATATATSWTSAACVVVTTVLAAAAPTHQPATTIPRQP